MQNILHFQKAKNFRATLTKSEQKRKKQII